MFQILLFRVCDLGLKFIVLGSMNSCSADLLYLGLFLGIYELLCVREPTLNGIYAFDKMLMFLVETGA